MTCELRNVRLYGLQAWEASSRNDRGQALGEVHVLAPNVSNMHSNNNCEIRMVEQIESDPDTDIQKAVEILEGEIDASEEITGLRAPGKRRACFRLRLKDGRIVKGRRFASVEKRETFTSLCPALDRLPFSRVLAAHGAATIEEWVPGTPVEPDDLVGGFTGDLATVLGNLNRRPIPREASTAKIRGVNWHTNRLRNFLAELTTQGHVNSTFTTKIFDLASDNQPPDFECGVIHTDFHPQNMVLREQNEICTIDNEGLRIGVLDFDIARCWRRWPMTREQRNVFRQAYGHFRCLDSFLAHQKFWSISTLALTARINERHGRPIQGYLNTLAQIVQNEDDALWPQHSPND